MSKAKPRFNEDLAADRDGFENRMPSRREDDEAMFGRGGSTPTAAATSSAEPQPAAAVALVVDDSLAPMRRSTLEDLVQRFDKVWDALSAQGKCDERGGWEYWRCLNAFGGELSHFSLSRFISHEANVVGENSTICDLRLLNLDREWDEFVKDRFPGEKD